MKIISYSLFNHPSSQEFERRAYIRGFWFNCRMNRFIFPEWRTHVNLDKSVYSMYATMFEWLKINHSISYTINDETPQLCEGMIQRMRPCFDQHTSHVMCRDADSLTTYREALAIQDWLESGDACLALHDNPGHDGLMGGMVAFDTSQFKALTGYQTWEEMIDGYDLKERGSDQHLMNGRILPKIKVRYVGGKNKIQLDTRFEQRNLPMVHPKFFESNFCISFIGAAGVNELETIRFFKRIDEYEWAFNEIERVFPKLFPWHS